MNSYLNTIIEQELQTLKKQKQLLTKKSWTLEELGQLYPSLDKTAHNQVVVAKRGGATHFYQANEQTVTFLSELAPYQYDIQTYNESYQYPDYFYLICAHQTGQFHQFVYQAKLAKLMHFVSSDSSKYLPHDFLVTTKEKQKNNQYLIGFDGESHLIQEKGILKPGYQKCQYKLGSERVTLYFYQDQPIYGYASPIGIIASKQDFEACLRLLAPKSASDQLTALQQQLDRFDACYLACPEEYPAKQFRLIH